MSKEPYPILVDPKAEEILEQVDYDFDQLDAPKKTLVTLAMRAKQLDSYVRDYLARTENPLVVHLGCGLDSRVLRVDFERGSWFDIDYPEVIELRRHFYEESDSYHMIGSSVTERGWLDVVAGVASGPACVIAEGLLMYLHDSEVRRLLEDLQSALPGSEIAFDAFSRFTAKQVNRHPSIKKTGAHIYWGVDDPGEIEQWGTGMTLLDEWFFNDSEDVATLGLGSRLMFKATGMIGAAKNAQRILRYRV
jgi:O-methyltransferase involved in polyketide biosynthesis